MQPLCRVLGASLTTLDLSGQLPKAAPDCPPSTEAVAEAQRGSRLPKLTQQPGSHQIAPWGPASAEVEGGDAKGACPTGARQPLALKVVSQAHVTVCKMQAQVCMAPLPLPVGCRSGPQGVSAPPVSSSR